MTLDLDSYPGPSGDVTRPPNRLESTPSLDFHVPTRLFYAIWHPFHPEPPPPVSHDLVIWIARHAYVLREKNISPVKKTVTRVPLTGSINLQTHRRTPPFWRRTNKRIPLVHECAKIMSEIEGQSNVYTCSAMNQLAWTCTDTETMPPHRYPQLRKKRHSFLVMHGPQSLVELSPWMMWNAKPHPTPWNAWASHSFMTLNNFCVVDSPAKYLIKKNI